MTTVAIEHKHIYYSVTGKGEPLVLIHSALMDSRMWSSQIVAFAEKYRVLTYDLYGYGQSSFTDEKRINHPSDLVTLLDTLHIEQAHILGASMGGEIALRFVIEYPRRTRSLILVGAGLEGYDYPEESFAWWGAFMDAMRQDDFETARTLFIQNALDSTSAPLTSTQQGTIQAIMHEYTFRHYLDDTLLWYGYDTPAIQHLHEITCPTLIVVGEADTPTQQDIAQVLQRNTPQASLKTIPNAGHLPNLQQPEAFNQTVRAFLDKA